MLVTVVSEDESSEASDCASPDPPKPTEDKSKVNTHVQYASKTLIFFKQLLYKQSFFNEIQKTNITVRERERC